MTQELRNWGIDVEGFLENYFRLQRISAYKKSTDWWIVFPCEPEAQEKTTIPNRFLVFKRSRLGNAPRSRVLREEHFSQSYRLNGLKPQNEKTKDMNSCIIGVLTVHML